MALPGGPKFSCKIELDQQNGVTIIIQDAILKDQIEKKITLADDALTLSVKNLINSTTVTQKKDSIETKVTGPLGITTILQDGSDVTVTCKTFTVNADTINLKATLDGNITTGTTCTIKSTTATDIEATTGMTLKSVTAMSLDSKESVSIKALTNLDMEGLQTTVKGTTSLTAQSSGTTNLQGLTVSVKGDTQTTVEAPVTQVGQNMTTIKGQLIEVSGALVKIG